MLALRDWEASDCLSISGYFFSRPDGPPTLTATRDGAPIGFVWFTANDGISAYLTMGLTEVGEGHGGILAPLAVAYAFQRFDIHRLATTVVAGNAAAIHLAESWGVEEGQLREAFRDAEGLYHDVLIYSLLREEA